MFGILQYTSIYFNILRNSTSIEFTSIWYTSILSILNIFNILHFIHSIYFYSVFSSPLLFRCAPDTARILCWCFTAKRHMTCPRSLYAAARAGFQTETLKTKGVGSNNEPPRPSLLAYFNKFNMLQFNLLQYTSMLNIIQYAGFKRRPTTIYMYLSILHCIL